VDVHEVLRAAAETALRAPSILNTQPWRWGFDGAFAHLHADRDRQLAATDPLGRLLLVSCGAALHHARVSVAASGWRPQVRREVRTSHDELLAHLWAGDRCEPTAEERAQHDAIERRHTDRRPFSAESVPADVIRRLRAAAWAEGAALHQVRTDQMPLLAIAAARAGADELARGEYRGELSRWTHRPLWSGDGVPPHTVVRAVPRRVPVRAFALDPDDGTPVAAGGDEGAAYLILHGDSDEPADWLRAGEALSAVLLTATAHGLATAPMSDVVEVEHSRRLLGRLIGENSFPYLVVRSGFSAYPDEPRHTLRRDAEEVIDHPAG
jgi:hypothetical protein